MAARIYITPAIRLKWHAMLVAALAEWHAEEAAAKRDGRAPEGKPLPDVAPAVAIQIGRHFDNRTAETFVGQETIALEMGISPRLIFTCIHGYEDRGLLLVRHGGRRSNYMAMPVEKVAQACEISKWKRSHENEQRSHETTEKVAPACERSLSNSNRNSIPRLYRNASAKARRWAEAWDNVDRAIRAGTECYVVETYTPHWHELIAWHEANGDHRTADLMRHRAELGASVWTAPRGWLPSKNITPLRGRS